MPRQAPPVVGNLTRHYRLGIKAVFGAIMGGIGIAKEVGGLFGGGGPRAPRMNECHKQNIHQNPHMQAGCCQQMKFGCNRVNAAAGAFYGNQFNPGFGPLANQGMFGANNFAMANSWNNGYNSLFQQPSFGPGFGYGPQSGFPGGSNVSVAIGINMNNGYA